MFFYRTKDRGVFQYTDLCIPWQMCIFVASKKKKEKKKGFGAGKSPGQRLCIQYISVPGCVCMCVCEFVCSVCSKEGDNA